MTEEKKKEEKEEKGGEEGKKEKKFLRAHRPFKGSTRVVSFPDPLTFESEAENLSSTRGPRRPEKCVIL